ncbi:MAG: hypothetical protein IT548_15895 [Alphaproteobacteria bacterium]|nr:hypothetical protein [Alphaproteobacteria bacterium]
MPDRSDAYRRYKASTTLDYDAWKEGTPYDVAALDGMSAEERGLVEADLLALPKLDWRDVEALRRLDTPKARDRIHKAGHAQTDGAGVQALGMDAEDGWSADIETRFIRKLAQARLMEGAFERLFAIAEAHPTPKVRAALLRLAAEGHDDVRYAYGAFLLYLNGHASTWYGFEPEYRPHLLALKETGESHAAAVAWLKGKVDHPQAAT